MKHLFKFTESKNSDLSLKSGVTSEIKKMILTEEALEDLLIMFLEDKGIEYEVHQVYFDSENYVNYFDDEGGFSAIRYRWNWNNNRY
jgi:hypothetical protein